MIQHWEDRQRWTPDHSSVCNLHWQHLQLHHTWPLNIQPHKHFRTKNNAQCVVADQKQRQQKYV